MKPVKMWAVVYDSGHLSIHHTRPAAQFYANGAGCVIRVRVTESKKKRRKR